MVETKRAFRQWLNWQEALGRLNKDERITTKDHAEVATSLHEVYSTSSDRLKGSGGDG